jgi:hypothetical protein
MAVEQLDLFSHMGVLPWQALYEEALANDMPAEEIKDKSKEELISALVQRGITHDKIKSLMERYAYGRVVTFSLWHAGTEVPDNALDTLTALVGREFHIAIPNLRKLQIASVLDKGSRVEIIYKYSKRHLYLDENGMEQTVWEQNIGCAWVGNTLPYIALIGKDEKVWSKMANIIADALNITITPIRPPQKAIDRCFATAIKSKVTLVGPDGDRTTLSRAEGFTPEQEQENERLSSTRKRVSGGFKTTIGEHQNVSARFNSTKGNITIQKHLPVEDLFAWTEQAISIIFEEMENLKGKPASEVFTAIGKEITWPGLSAKQYESLEWLLSKLLTGTNITGTITIDVPQEMVDLLEDNKLFFSVYRPYCNGCEAPTGAVCAECNSILTPQNLAEKVCPNGHPLISGEEYRIVCPEGHKLPTYAANHCWFFPTTTLSSKLDGNIHKIYPGSNLSKRWYVGNMQLVIHPERVQARELFLSDFDEFGFDGGSVTTARKKWLIGRKEKCSGCSHTKCGQCADDIQDTCLMRLFYPLLPGYRPQPHKGGEYGDISGQVGVNGQRLELKGILKSNRSRGTDDEKIHAVLLSSTAGGQEIIRQVVEQGIVDARCGVLAIVVPQYIDADFKGTLRYLCGLVGKHITFWQLDELCHITQKFKLAHQPATGASPSTIISSIP